MTSQQPAPGMPATFQVYYQEPYNAIVRSHKGYLWYFRVRWMPDLQPVGTAIVLFLRGLCYHNPDKGELRDVCECRLEEIAAGIGVSRATVARELGDKADGTPANPALRLFVMRQAQYDKTSQGIRRASSLYHVSMDDPIHPDDAAQYQLLCQEYEERRKQNESPLRPLIRTLELKKNTTARESQNEIHGRPQRIRESHFEHGESQNETALKSLYSSIPIKNLKNLTLNVSEDNIPVDLPIEEKIEKDVGHPKSHNAKAKVMDKLVASVVAELQDLGSERRHRQLLSICDQHGLNQLAQAALQATRRRMAAEGDQGPLERPGAYYQRILIALLEEHQVFIPTLADRNQDDPNEVRCLARRSLGLEE